VLHSLRIVLVCAALFLVAGCNQSPTVPVTGVVMFNGKPAADADVMFNPKTGRIATGVTDANGRFALATFAPNDGALPGDYVVTLCEYYPPDKPPKMSSGPLPSRFPTKYGNPSTSPITAHIERGQKNEFQFEVK
jgi:hypothetical protein